MIAWGCPGLTWCCIWTCPQTGRWSCSASGRQPPTPRDYLAACRAAALEAGRLYGWKRLPCLDGAGALRDVEEIHKEIWQAVRPLLSGREKA